MLTKRHSPQGAASVVAYAGDNAEHAVAVRQGDFGAAESDFGQSSKGQVSRRSHVLEIGIRHVKLSAWWATRAARSTSVCS